MTRGEVLRRKMSKKICVQLNLVMVFSKFYTQLCVAHAYNKIQLVSLWCAAYLVGNKILLDHSGVAFCTPRTFMPREILLNLCLPLFWCRYILYIYTPVWRVVAGITIRHNMYVLCWAPRRCHALTLRICMCNRVRFCLGCILLNTTETEKNILCNILKSTPTHNIQERWSFTVCTVLKLIARFNMRNEWGRNARWWAADSCSGFKPCPTDYTLL